MTGGVIRIRVEPRDTHGFALLEIVRQMLAVLTRPQRGVHTCVGRSCPVRRYYIAAARPKTTQHRGRGERRPRVRPEGLKSQVVPADG
jgi:hypothetical protein